MIFSFSVRGFTSGVNASTMGALGSLSTLSLVPTMRASGGAWYV